MLTQGPPLNISINSTDLGETINKFAIMVMENGFPN